jgi:hypothetical protein
MSSENVPWAMTQTHGIMLAKSLRDSAELCSTIASESRFIGDHREADGMAARAGAFRDAADQLERFMAGNPPARCYCCGRWLCKELFEAMQKEVGIL